MDIEIFLKVQEVNFLNELKKTLWKRDLSFELKRGQIFLITGPSGSGKTTLLDCILNLKAPKDLVGKMKIKQDYTYLTTKNYLLSTENVFKNISQYYNIYDYRADIKGLLEYLRVVEKVDPTELVQTLSFGTKRRVALYRTLHIDKSYYLLDEPTTGFDSLKIDEANNFIKNMSLKGKSFLIVSHEPGTAKIADRLLIISETPYVVPEINPYCYLKVLKEEELLIDEIFKYLGIEGKKVFEYKNSPHLVYEFKQIDLIAVKKSTENISNQILETKDTSLFNLNKFFLSPINSKTR